MIEVKHEISQALSMKTRGVATLMDGTHPSVPRQVLAKASVSPPPDCQDHNGYMVNLFLNRHPGDKTKTRPFVSVREQWVKMVDVFRLEREVTLNLEYDFKRRPVEARMVTINQQDSHLAFDTEPWKCVEEAEQARAIFDNWRKTRCLKTLDDWDDWQDEYLTAITLDKVRKRLGTARLPFQVTHEGSLGIFKRMFLRAYAQQAWGLTRIMTNPKLITTLKELGCPVTEHDAKNGNKGKLIPNVVPRTSRTEMLLDDLLPIFTTLDAGQIFAQD